MSNLTNDQIEKLKEIHPKKLLFRKIFLITGITLVVVGLILLIFGVDFGLKMDELNISFIIDLLLIVSGMIIASKYFIAPYYLRENSLTIKKLRDLREPVKSFVKLNSFSLSRLIAAGLLIFVGFYNLIIFGSGVGHHETNYGNAFVLGGPSWFYFTGLPFLAIGFSLLLYVALSIFRGTFSQSENFYFFYEVRPGFPWLTEVPKKDIEAIRYQNTEVGPKLGWIMLMIPFIVMQLQTGIPLFFNNERAAPGYVLSWTFVISSIIEIFVLIILVVYHQDYYEIASKDLLYEMWLTPIQKEKARVELSKHLQCGIEKRDEDLKGQDLFNDISDTHFQLFDLVFGLLLIVSGIIMLTMMILFGPLFWWVALMYGVMLLVKALNKDFSRKGEDLFYYNEQEKIFKFQRKFAFKFHTITTLNTESVKVKKWFRKLDFFDIFGLGGMLIMLTVQQVEGWSIADTSSVIADNIISSIFMIVVFIFIFLYLCMPIDVVEFKTPTITYRIRITKKLKETSLSKKWINNLKSLLKDATSDDLSKTFKIRALTFLILIVGSLLVTIALLVSYFV